MADEQSFKVVGAGLSVNVLMGDGEMSLLEEIYKDLKSSGKSIAGSIIPMIIIFLFWMWCVAGTFFYSIDNKLYLLAVVDTLAFTYFWSCVPSIIGGIKSKDFKIMGAYVFKAICAFVVTVICIIIAMLHTAK
jgi:hypothetical protein